MISLKNTVYSALTTSIALTTLLGTGQRTFFHRPDDANLATFPRLTYFELDNFGNLFADNSEYGSEIDYQVDVWHTASTTAIANQVDTIMTGIGFIRLAGPDLYEKDNHVFHKALRYQINQETT
jgi:hypothetical protein